jgi:2-succinyl-5-enolpyruvyl-6-hydroxy-3-cyclohexene-1-carboxylate synthase
MIPINRTYAPVQAFVEELARCGVRHAVTCPGSRNAPLILSLAAQEGIDAISVLDERSGAFMALGLAKASGRPVAITCTSGTAAANLMPAVAEAHEARVPLIVLTADRPPELRDVGAGQAIDQVKLYGDAVNWFVEVGNHEPSRATAVHHRALACRAYASAAGGRPGPVHLNFPLRDPLAPEPEDLPPADWEGRADGRPWVDVREHSSAPHAGDIQGLADRAAASPRGVIVCGPSTDDVADQVARLAAASGWPVLAEPASGLRCGEHDRSRVVAHYDVLLRGGSFAAAHRPQLVVRVGDTPTSKPLREWLPQAPQAVLDPHGAWHEPTRSAELVIQAAAGPACDALAGSPEGRDAKPHPGLF